MKGDEVIIIGAGMSGIKAAAELTAAGISTTMLEARNRIGGRISTVRTKDSAIYELGASWIHDTLRNELFPMAVDLGLNIYYDNGEYSWFDRNGEIPSTSESLRLKDDIDESISQEYAINDKKPDISYQDYCRNYINKHSLSLSDHVKKVGPQAARFMELWHGISWGDISTKFSSMEKSSGDALIKSGYDTILNHVYGQINRNHFSLHLDSPVQKIEQINRDDDGSKSYYIVTTSSGKSFKAKYVILTVPIGVLKSASIQITPSLPLNITTAIKNSSLAALGKIFIEFTQVFWRTDLENFVVLADSEQVSDTVGCVGKAGNIDDILIQPWSAPVFFSNSFLITGRKGLFVLTSPPITQYVESNPHKAYEFLKPMLEVLRIDKSNPLPNVSFLMVSNWTNDPYARCSYGATTVGENLVDNVQAFCTGAGNLRLAGDYTELDANGCVNAAFKSGRREAFRIIEQISAHSNKQNL